MADETETQEQGKPATPKSFWKNLSWLEIGAIIVPILFIIYLRNSTGLVLNYNDGNTTRIINGIPNPPKTIIYTPNSFVPKSGVSNTEMGVGILIYIVCILILLQKKLKEKRRATPKEAMDDLSKQIKGLKNIPLEDGTTIPITDNTKININPTFLTRYNESNEGMRKVWRYTFDVMVEDRLEGVNHHYRAWYHPWDWYWDGFFPTKMALSGKDACPECGAEYSFKILPSKLLKEFGLIKRGLGGTGRI